MLCCTARCHVLGLECFFLTFTMVLCMYCHAADTKYEFCFHTQNYRSLQTKLYIMNTSEFADNTLELNFDDLVETDSDDSLENFSTDSISPYLFDSSFVVLDLETTGKSPYQDLIIEIAAIKVCQGVEVDRFYSLVNPHLQLPEFIVELTGISQSAVDNAPDLETVLPGLIEFLRGSIPVAHNASFDLTFLQQAFSLHGYPWDFHNHICTLKFARRVLEQKDVPSYSLSDLSQHLNTEHKPIHRAIDDVLTTIDIFYVFLERVSSYIFSYDDLAIFLDTPPQQAQTQAKKITSLCRELPEKPGVFFLKNSRNQIFYIGSGSHIALDVREYFNEQNNRENIKELLRTCVKIDYKVCTNTLEATIEKILSEHTTPLVSSTDRNNQIAEHFIVLTTGEHAKKNSPVSSEYAYVSPAIAAHQETQQPYLIEVLPLDKLSDVVDNENYMIHGPLRNRQVAVEELSLIHHYLSPSTDDENVLWDTQKFSVFTDVSTSTLLDSLKNYWLNNSCDFLSFFTEKLSELSDSKEFGKAAKLRKQLIIATTSQSHLRKSMLLGNLGRYVVAHHGPDTVEMILVKENNLITAHNAALTADFDSLTDELVNSCSPQEQLSTSPLSTKGISPEEHAPSRQTTSSTDSHDDSDDSTEGTLELFSTDYIENSTEQSSLVTPADSTQRNNLYSHAQVLIASLLYDQLTLGKLSIMYSDNPLVQSIYSGEKYEMR